jgi:hypothetical protein
LKAPKILDYKSSIGRADGTMDDLIHGLQGVTVDEFIHECHKERGTK